VHSIRPDKPIPPLLMKLLTHVDKAARELQLPYFIGGAFARDLLLVHVHGLAIPRPTRDVDIGVAVQSWREFDELKGRLVATGDFSNDKDIVHRLRFLASAKSSGTPLDILPFAGVEEEGSLLRWPPSRDVVMNVAGFSEALAVREEVRLGEDLVVPVASLPAQTLLKLAAWLDRRAETSRDAVDLLTLLRRYGDAGNSDRLYEDKAALLESAGYDLERAGASLLGEDVRAIAVSPRCEQVGMAFVSPDTQNALVTHMSSGIALADDDRIGKAQALIDAFLKGFGTSKSG
jgi:predicted nucleotidyltransferase